MELDYKRIVVTFLMHLGDVILTTPFLEVLRKAAPHSHITYVIAVSYTHLTLPTIA